MQSELKYNFITKILRWWASPNLPEGHVFIHPKKRPKAIIDRFRIYIRKWLVHPIKRRLAKYYLLILKKTFGIAVIGVTGSAGKTTTKDMITSILKRKGRTISSFENIDPVYNIPMTMLKCKPSTKYLVLEMGVEYPSEMDFYLWLVKPDIGVLTNVYPTHTEFFKDVKGVFREKSKLITSLPESGFAVLNSEHQMVKKLENSTKAKVILYGKYGLIKADNAKVTKDMNTEFTLVSEESNFNVHLPTVGEQFISNALAAASVGYACGASSQDIKKGLESYQKPKHRMNLIKLRSNSLVLDDSYNNNPEAAKETLKTFQEIANGKKKIIVFGDMLELGVWEKRYHRQLGRIIGKMGVDYLICVGNASKDTCEEAGSFLKRSKIKWVKDVDDVMSALLPKMSGNSAILVKGSRSIGLDKLIANLS